MTISQLDYQHVFGYYDSETFDEKSVDQKGVLLSNVLNGASILLSPLIGLIRLVGAAVMYFFSLSDQQKDCEMDLGGYRRYLGMQMFRGALEIICLGPILGTVVDISVTVSRKCCQSEELA